MPGARLSMLLRIVSHRMEIVQVFFAGGSVSSGWVSEGSVSVEDAACVASVGVCVGAAEGAVFSCVSPGEEGSVSSVGSPENSGWVGAVKSACREAWRSATSRSNSSLVKQSERLSLAVRSCPIRKSFSDSIWQAVTLQSSPIRLSICPARAWFPSQETVPP